MKNNIIKLILFLLPVIGGIFLVLMPKFSIRLIGAAILLLNYAYGYIAYVYNKNKEKKNEDA